MTGQLRLAGPPGPTPAAELLAAQRRKQRDQFRLSQEPFPVAVQQVREADAAWVASRYLPPDGAEHLLQDGPGLCPFHSRLERVAERAGLEPPRHKAADVDDALGFSLLLIQGADANYR